MLIGLLCAVAAAGGFGVATILQEVGVRRASAKGSLAGVTREPVYYLGLGLDFLGFLAMVVALHFLPLFLVQAVVAASVGVTAAIAAARGAVLGRPGWSALAAAAVGLVLLGVAADAQGARPLSTFWQWMLLVAVVPVGAVAAAGALARGPRAAPLLALGAGLAFTIVSIAARTLVIGSRWWLVLGRPDLWALAVAGSLGTALFAMALQKGTVTTVAAVTFTAETVVPSIVGLAWLGDSVRVGLGPVAALGFALAVGGAIVLARFAEPVG